MLTLDRDELIVIITSCFVCNCHSVTVLCMWWSLTGSTFQDYIITILPGFLIAETWLERYLQMGK